MKILTVDIGTGTQDIFLYDSRLDIENGLKLVVPSPTMILHRKLKAAARRGEAVLLEGVMMGGGPSAWGAEEILRPDMLMLDQGAVNAAKAAVRQAFADIFGGPGGATTRAQLTAVAKRKATRAEKLFASGTGSAAVPATLGFEGNLSYGDVRAARSS